MSKRWIAFCVLFLLIATACVGCTPDKKPDREDTDMKLAYKDIYKYTPQKTAELSGAIRYKASDGYVESMVQGTTTGTTGALSTEVTSTQPLRAKTGKAVK